MNRPLRELLLAELAGELRGGTVVDWAVAELERGVDTPATRVLAGLGGSCSLSEVEPYFASALAERGVARPVDENGLRRGHLLDLATDLLEGMLAPDVARKRIHAEVVGPLGHPTDLKPWCFLWEGLDPVTFDTLSDAEAGEALKEEARKLLSRRGEGGGV